MRSVLIFISLVVGVSMAVMISPEAASAQCYRCDSEADSCYYDENGYENCFISDGAGWGYDPACNVEMSCNNPDDDPSTEDPEIPTEDEPGLASIVLPSTNKVALESLRPGVLVQRDCQDRIVARFYSESAQKIRRNSLKRIALTPNLVPITEE